jgi:phytoene dehydrogenase-like protein
MRRAVVIGSGPNGLVGAIVLARAGFSVVVHEAAATVGGGLHTEELTLPGFRHDVCSAIHPMGRDSPAFRDLELPVEWVEPPAAAAHPFDDGTAVLLERDVDATADQLGADGAAYRRLVAPLVRHWKATEPLLLGPFPPPRRAPLAAARALGARTIARATRAALADARSLAESAFASERARGFFAGQAAHSMLPLERRPSAGFGLALLVMGHALGWPFPRGGAGALATALADRLREHGGEIQTSSPVGDLPDADVVLADVMPGELTRITRGRLPERFERALRRYRHGPAAFKLDWALSAPSPWTATECRRAGTIHLGATLDEISASEWASWTGGHAERPYVLLAQQSLFDPTRAPEGQHTAWAYCHVPNGSDVDATGAIEAQIERFAPGFGRLVLARSVLRPSDFERRNRNLVGGDVGGGASDLGQLLLRPTRRPIPYRTPIRGLYLCSSATPPGAGVHGMCGYGAARLALRDASG